MKVRRDGLTNRYDGLSSPFLGPIGPRDRAVDRES
jgi:hypothetical protein